MGGLNLYLSEKIIEETVRNTGSALYRSAYLIPQAPKPVEELEASKRKQCHCMQVKLARRAVLRVEFCS